MEPHRQDQRRLRLGSKLQRQYYHRLAVHLFVEPTTICVGKHARRTAKIFSMPLAQLRYVAEVKTLHTWTSSYSFREASCVAALRHIRRTPAC